VSRAGLGSRAARPPGLECGCPAGGWERIGDAVQRITGNPPRSLARFLADHAAAFHAA
jgi:hypothetical protein